MAFTTPCFVRIENVEKRKEIVKILKRIGYVCFGTCSQRSDREYICTNEMGFCLICAKSTINDGAYDCGEDTDLFLALVAKRDDADDRQWFTDGVDWGIFHQANPEDKLDVDGISFPYLPRQEYNIDNFRKATAEEIIEHYKNKR